MIVAVDGRHLEHGRGVARYARSMLEALRARFPDDEWRVVPDRGRVGNVARPLGRGADAVWLPAPAPARPAAPYVLTVHDLSWERRPADFTPYERLWHAAARPRALAGGAARVVCDTATVAGEVRERWGLDARVVTPGVDAPRPERAAAMPGLPDRFVLFVGALEPRKAPELLVGAHARARARGLRADLVLAGGGRRAARLRGRPGVHVLDAVGDAELETLYARALALVLPSWLEGFGFPPLEALARGTPAIVSDLPVFRETLGDAALRFPPGDAAALADALLRVEGERDALLAAAPPLPSWDAAADALHAVLAEAAR